MYDTILIPTDGSAEIAQVADQAIELASLCGAEVHVLNVVDERSYLTVPEDARVMVRETLEDDGVTFTKSVADIARDADLEVVTEIRWGDPSASILAYAVENDIDLIVMGTHGRTGFERYLLGSVAERVVRLAPMPVLAVAVGDTDRQRETITNAPLTDRQPPRKPDAVDIEPYQDEAEETVEPDEFS